MIAFSYMPNIVAQKNFLEEKRKQATALVISLLDKLTVKNILCAEHLDFMLNHSVLINPIDQLNADSSNEAFTYREQLNKIISSDTHGLLDVAQIHEWVRNKLAELEKRSITREEVFQKTKDIRRAIGFVEIPRGTYTSSIDGSNIHVPQDIEVPETLVTQYQWAQVIGENPSKQTNGFDSEEVVLHGKKILMRPDAPVEAIDLNQIQQFIGKLNDKDPVYAYSLPSINEYDAVVQASLGKNWFEAVPCVDSCSEKCQPGSVSTQRYVEYHDKRIWAIIGSLWQWTRDFVELNEPLGAGHLVFGTSYATKKTVLNKSKRYVRPVHYNFKRTTKCSIEMDKITYE